MSASISTLIFNVLFEFLLKDFIHLVRSAYACINNLQSYILPDIPLFCGSVFCSFLGFYFTKKKKKSILPVVNLFTEGKLKVQ